MVFLGKVHFPSTPVITQHGNSFFDLLSLIPKLVQCEDSW